MREDGEWRRSILVVGVLGRIEGHVGVVDCDDGGCGGDDVGEEGGEGVRGGGGQGV